MLVIYGAVVMFAAIVEVRDRAEFPTAPSWTILHLVVLLALSLSLLRGLAWAWWGAIVLVGVELLLLLPLAIAVVGGAAAGAAELMSLLDIALVTAEVLLLAVALWLLIQVRRAPG